ncbi:RidA family protein [Fusobacterium simiae]|uniref:RidA family protein n=1 Tax=Fusobacterium simiae TaxID=855 RepID=A0ABT4DHT3_FUSSI|nr:MULTISPECIES: RidA family protein [Fusobacterium]MCY7008170.1 RidA family protein [Fusobacterium simiae]MDC7954323.1 RidA family protein [Fusobacterium simiae]
MSNPKPQGKYVLSKRYENLIFTAGMTPRKNGELILTGKFTDENIEQFKEAVRLAAENTLSAIQKSMKENEKIESILSMNVYINSSIEFTKHSKIADYASEYYYEKLGDLAIASRTAVGVISLPGNAPIEIQVVVAVNKN